MHTLGHTRSVNQRDYILHTPDTFVWAAMPHLQQGLAVVHISPASGAAFTQYTAELQPGGTLGSAFHQRFMYVLQGHVSFATGEGGRTLGPGEYAYFPPLSNQTLAAGAGARITVIEKPYRSFGNIPVPEMHVGNADSLASFPLQGDPDLQVRQLLPESSEFDFAVNIMTYEPGAALSQVEVHVMEHGLFLLQGGGIYRLGERWYPVAAGDFVWMAPFCPQWFGALGKQPAKYLIYKDTNRLPLE